MPKNKRRAANFLPEFKRQRDSQAVKPIDLPQIPRDSQAAEQFDEPQIPPEFYCPIAQDLMVRPVQTNCGHIFDETSLNMYLNKSPAADCPCCRAKLDQTKFSAEKSLAKKISDYLQQQPDLAARTDQTWSLVLQQAMRDGTARQDAIALQKQRADLERTLYTHTATIYTSALPTFF